MSVYSEIDPLPDGTSIVQVGLVDHDIAKNYGVDVALKADVKETLRALIPALKAIGGSALAKRAKQGLADLDSGRGNPSGRLRLHVSAGAAATPSATASGSTGGSTGGSSKSSKSGAKKGSGKGSSGK